MSSRHAIAIVCAVIALAGGPPSVDTFGAIRELIARRDTGAKVALADIVRTPHAHGLGSLSDLRGEITILDGTVWLSYPPARPGDAPKVVSAAGDEQAGFLVAAHVEPTGWRRIRMDTPFSSEDLERLLQKLVAPGGSDLPFRIDAKFATLTLAIVDGRKLSAAANTPEQMKQANHRQTEAQVEGTLVGFMAAKDDGRFTHPHTRVHVHAVVPARRATGHAQAFVAEAGATLWLPDGF